MVQVRKLLRSEQLHRLCQLLEMDLQSTLSSPRSANLLLTQSSPESLKRWMCELYLGNAQSMPICDDVVIYFWRRTCHHPNVKLSRKDSTQSWILCLDGQCVCSVASYVPAGVPGNITSMEPCR